VARHAHEHVLAHLLRCELIFHERLARQVQHQRRPEIEAGQCDGSVDALQPRQLECGVPAAGLRCFWVAQHGTARLLAKRLLPARPALYRLRSPAARLYEAPTPRAPGGIDRPARPPPPPDAVLPRAITPPVP